jgi:UDP-N-acetylmuramate--alanine ligase
MAGLKNFKHVFFSGIGGIGMSAMARILLEDGFKVSGSDRELSDITRQLTDLGAVIYEGQRAENIRNADVLVYSSAIAADNPERVAAGQLRIPVIRRAEMLAEMMRLKYCLAIAGTHGKTTTSAMCTTIFRQAGLDPTFLVGGRLLDLKTNARAGKGEFFITEADEYDRSFLALNPAFALITNIEADHLDCYHNLDEIKKAFTSFARKVPFYGAVICCSDDAGVMDILPELNNRIITYGLNKQADYQATRIKLNNDLTTAAAATTFDLKHRGKSIGNIKLVVPGEHNVKNALAAIALANENEIPFHHIQTALAAFHGVERRFEIKGVIDQTMVIDDYAHHPTELGATLSTAKKIWPGRVLAAFQPHLFSRTRDFYKQFADRLLPADLIFITDIYPAREKPIPGITAEMIVQELIKRSHPAAWYIPERKTIAAEINKQVRTGDMVLFMGAGDIWKSATELTELLKIKKT